MYVGNGCVSNRLFKLNVIVVKLKNNRAISRGGQLKIQNLIIFGQFELKKKSIKFQSDLQN